MTPSALQKLLARVKETPVAPEYAPEPYQIDWGGRKRGQGRRFGRGKFRMVLGAMSDAPTGIKTYYRTLPNAPEEERKDVLVLDDLGRLRYLQARSAGLNHDQAWLIGLHSQGGCTFEELAQAPAFSEKKASAPCGAVVERRLPLDEARKDGSVTYRFEPKEWSLTCRNGPNDWKMYNADKRSAPKAYAWACRNQDRLPTMTWDEIYQELRNAGARISTWR